MKNFPDYNPASNKILVIGEGVEVVVLTGAGGRVAQATALLLANRYNRAKQCWTLRLVETHEGRGKALALREELLDCCFEGLDVETAVCGPGAFKGADGVILAGATPRQPGQTRADLLDLNAPAFAQQGAWIGQEAHEACRILVVGNPCNTLCWLAWKCSGRPPDRFTAMTELDGFRAKGALARQLQVSLSDIQHCAVWGNHSETCIPDRWHARIAGKPVERCVSREWLTRDWTSWVQQRGSEVLRLSGSSTAISAAQAIAATWWSHVDTLEGEWLSAGCWTTGPLPEGLFMGAACESRGDRVIPLWHKVNEELLDALQPSLRELLNERDAVRHLLGGAR